MLSRLGLGARLALLGLLVALAVSLAGGWALREQIRGTLVRGVEQSLNQRIERLRVHLHVAVDGSLYEEGGRSGDEFNQIFSGWYWQLQHQGHTLRSRSLWDGALALDRAVPLGSGGLLRAEGPRGESLVGLRRQVALDEGQVMLDLFGPAADMDSEFDRLDQVLLATQAILIAVLLASTVAQIRWGLRPLRRLQGRLARVHAGTAERVGTDFGPDLAPLAEEIDTVLERNARIVARARHHAADLSHALKKPLTLLGAEARRPEVAGTVVQAEVAAMTRLIERHLARAGSGAGERRRLSLKEPVTSLVALMQRLHAARGLAWRVDMAPHLEWSGEPTDFEEMLGNLLDNAGKWAGSQVVVTGTTVPGGVELTVEDDGPGIASSDLAEAARRGRRFDESTEGSGLGLAIVAGIAETYQSSLALERGALGGLRARLVLNTSR